MPLNNGKFDSERYRFFFKCLPWLTSLNAFKQADTKKSLCSTLNSILYFRIRSVASL